MSNPAAYDLGSYPPPRHTATPPPAAVYPPIATDILDTLDQLEATYPGINRNTAQVIAHVLAFTRHPAPALLDIAVQFAQRETAKLSGTHS